MITIKRNGKPVNVTIEKIEEIKTPVNQEEKPKKRSKKKNV